MQSSEFIVRGQAKAVRAITLIRSRLDQRRSALGNELQCSAV